MPLDADTSLTSEGAADLGDVPPSTLEQTLMEMDHLGVEETRDLLISVLFVLNTWEEVRNIFRHLR